MCKRSAEMKECRGGCGDTETMNHILQFCHRTHSSRLKCHNAITSYIVKKCEKRRWQVYEEEKIKVGDNIVKPGLVIAKGNRIIVINAQVVGDQRELDRAHQDKKRKYGTGPTGEAIKQRFGVESATFTSATLN